MQVVATSPPAQSLIAPFGAAEGHYVDAYSLDVPNEVGLRDFVAAFYTTPLFRAERLVLRVFARIRSSDAEARALAAGETSRFAAWEVDARRGDEILLADLTRRTKSWLCVAPTDGGTRLWFGSVIVPVERRGRKTLGPVFDSLIGPHQVYSRALLAAAARRLAAGD